MRKRRAEVTAIATELGLRSWPDDSLPYDLSLEGTPFENWTKLFNIYEGILKSRPVAILDFRRKVGKSSWSRTIIAVKTTEDVFANKPFELETRQVGGWQLLYHPPTFLNAAKLMDVYQIEALLKDVERA